LRNTFPSTDPGTAPSTQPAAQTSREAAQASREAASGNWQFTWRTPLPADGTIEQLAAWAEVLTGLEFDTTNVVHRLDDEAWLARRQKLEAIGEPVMP
jgi:hypothetical protein